MVVRRKLYSAIKEKYEYDIEDFNKSFKVLRLDEEKFVLEYKEQGIVVCIDWEDLRGEIDEVVRRREEEELIYLLDKSSIEKNNKNIEIYEDMGFYSKKEKYCEVLLTYDSYKHEVKSTFERGFKLGHVDITISEPSDLYKLLFASITKDKFFDSWDYYETIKLKCCEYDDIDSILQQVLFIVGKYEKPEDELIGDYPRITTFIREYNSYIWNDPDEEILIDKNDFIQTKYHEPLAFYNKARMTDEPVYYYRVLEFFFIINRKLEIKDLIDDYNVSDNIDDFMKNITNLYGNKEEKDLDNLIRNIIGIDEVIQQAHNYGLVNSNDTRNFSKELYKYRNSIVHAKWDYRHDINVPNVLQENVKDIHWLVILKRLAELVIQQFCF